MNPRFRSLLPAVAGLLLLSGCSAGYRPTPVPTIAPTRATPSARPADCGEPTQTFDASPLGAPGQVPSNSTMGRIADRGRLIVGVSSDTVPMAARDARSGDITGFEIDLARSLADAILGPGGKLDLRVVTPADAAAQLAEQEVDLVINQVSMTCANWSQGLLSAPYLATSLVPVTRPGVSYRVESLLWERSCAPAGTSAVELVQDSSRAVLGRTWSDCLMRFQRGDADLLLAPRPVAAGLAAQDPYAVVGDRQLQPERFAVMAPKQNVDMIRFVNAVLAQRQASGEWQRSYDRWVRQYAGEDRQPEPLYGRRQ